MASRSGEAKVLLRIAFRNLVASRAKTLIIGGIILLGTVLVVVGSSLLDSVDRGMRSSIQGSLGGQLQLYSARSKDELALYGGMMGESDLEPIDDFARVKRALEGVPNVKTLVPMGIDQALVATGNPLDVALEKLRADARRLEEGDRAPELLRAYEAHKAHVRRMVRVLRDDLAKARAIISDAALKERQRDWDDLNRGASDAFWAAFEADRLGALEFLENRVAPTSTDSGFTFVRYVGTDLDLFVKAFDRTQIVEGTAVPKGQRGILLGKWYAEEYLKLPAAHRLDKIKDARDLQHRTIAKDEELRRWAKENGGATKDIVLQLDPIQAEEATRRLQRALGASEGDLTALLQRLMDVDDRSFDRHYHIFYDELAPLLRLYLIRPGDVITIKAPAKSGYMNSVNVKVYGFVQFRGLERSSIAGVMSLLDLMTFRDLYGYMTPEKSEEVRRLRAAVGAREVARDRAEAELFGAPGAARAPELRAGAMDDAQVLSEVAGASRRKVDLTRVHGQDEIDSGVALNAAVLLKDPSRLRETQRALQAASDAAGLGLKVVDWQKASGLVGQFVTLARLILWTAVLIIFAVALVIINNAMVMATLQRVKEIGTMRAIGAQRRFVLLLLLAETVATGVAFGLAGAAAGAGVVALIRRLGGIPATSDQLYFFFSGPALLPTVRAAALVLSFAIVVVVSVLSGFYPALIAMRVTPVEAMAADD